MTARLLTNIGRLWTGSEILSNAAIVTSDDRIAWVGPSAELPRSVPGVVDDIVDVDLVENLGGGLVTPGLIDGTPSWPCGPAGCPTPRSPRRAAASRPR
jgi:imidazolonepropionase